MFSRSLLDQTETAAFMIGSITKAKMELTFLEAVRSRKALSR